MEQNTTTPPEAPTPEERLATLEARLAEQNEHLATAEAQRDEALSQAACLANRMDAQRRLAESGVADIETASALLEKRLDLTDDNVTPQRISGEIERLLVDKPFLLGQQSGAPGLPDSTQSARDAPETAASAVVRAAQRAARTGNRRDIAEYLRLRRQVSE